MAYDAGRESGRARAGATTKEVRIAHVLESLAVGGAERLALDLASTQARALESGERPSVWVVNLGKGGEPLERELHAGGVETVTFTKAPGVDLALVPRLVAWFSRNRVNVVHTHHPLCRIYAGPAARLAGAQVVNTLHGESPDLWRRMLLRRAATQFVDAFVVVSPRLTEFAEKEEAADAGKIVVIENGVDVNRFRPTAGERARIRSKLGARDDEWIVGTAARLSPEKDLAVLIEAAAPLLEPASRLLIAGDGAERAALEGLTRVLGVTRRVTFLGMMPDVSELLPALDVFALSSRAEGLPLAMLEAMATGVPVVATSVGGIPGALAHGCAGVVVPPRDVAAMRAALELLRDHPADARALGARGREAVLARFSSRRMQDEYEKLYLELLQAAA